MLAEVGSVLERDVVPTLVPVYGFTIPSDIHEYEPSTSNFVLLHLRLPVAAQPDCRKLSHGQNVHNRRPVGFWCRQLGFRLDTPP